MKDELLEIYKRLTALFCAIFPTKVGGLDGNHGGGGRDNRWEGPGCNPGGYQKLGA